MERISLILTPVCRNVADPTWIEPALQALQWALEDQEEILADARRVTGRDYCLTLLDEWPNDSQAIEVWVNQLSQGKLAISAVKDDDTDPLRFEDEVQLLMAFGRIICEHSIKNNMLISTQVEYAKSLS